jgi:hypothetical protein
LYLFMRRGVAIHALFSFPFLLCVLCSSQVIQNPPCSKTIHCTTLCLCFGTLSVHEPLPLSVAATHYDHTCLGFGKTVHVHRIWPYIWWFPCQKYRIYTVYIYGSGQPYTCSHVTAGSRVFVALALRLPKASCPEQLAASGEICNGVLYKRAPSSWLFFSPVDAAQS